MKKQEEKEKELLVGGTRMACGMRDGLHVVELLLFRQQQQQGILLRERTVGHLNRITHSLTPPGTPERADFEHDAVVFRGGFIWGGAAEVRTQKGRTGPCVYVRTYGTRAFGGGGGGWFLEDFGRFEPRGAYLSRRVNDEA